MRSEHVHPRSGKRRQTEDRIIDAAAKLFLEHGFRATTIRAVAQAAEVSVGRVMAVGDKDAVLVRCFDRWIGQLQNGTYTPPPRRTSLSRRGTDTGAEKGPPRPTSAVQRHLFELFLPFLEFFAEHEDLSRDYAAAMMRVKGEPEVFNTLAVDLQSRLSESLVSIGINEDHAQASATALYDSYLGILFRWAATTMSRDDAVEAMLASIVFHTRVRSSL
ncbi:DNA-binding transcriptional regulator, AcrR family [Brevibacterium siliguriense]|uniref:DNA-binding transcriptional regulator, AcrR family n=1 Tax=Brevibacterium siliguriense TaxID=1136497 RepID=A0A1H1LNP0_9MICO|nr:TetR/AcrR family transcriptional regulator [Brevibacterium siliguriense]SDR76151.1 DNA-binding transcriptional regulator, AcrR family [Brevibacterium siliguriense]